MKRSVIVFVAIFALSFFYFFTKEALDTSRVQERYSGNNFTMVVPVGSTPVKLKNSTQPVGEQQMVQNAYSFRNGSVSYSISACGKNAGGNIQSDGISSVQCWLFSNLLYLSFRSTICGRIRSRRNND